MSEPRWNKLDAELDHWYRQGLRCGLWWRDDDLIALTPGLLQLHALADDFTVDVLVAVIPAQMSEELGRLTAGMYRFCFCQHGYLHHNHAESVSSGSSEFPVSRPLHVMRDELQRGAEMLKKQFGTRLMPVLVPPWNDIDDAMAAVLPAAGFTGLSRYAMRKPQYANGLFRVDCHLDVADWAAAPRFREEYAAALLDRLIAELQERRQDPGSDTAPLGILTHHRAMDANAWQFMRKLLRLTQAHPAVDWLSPRTVFQRQPEQGGQHHSGSSERVAAQVPPALAVPHS